MKKNFQVSVVSCRVPRWPSSLSRIWDLKSKSFWIFCWHDRILKYMEKIFFIYFGSKLISYVLIFSIKRDSIRMWEAALVPVLACCVFNYKKNILRGLNNLSFALVVRCLLMMEPKYYLKEFRQGFFCRMVSYQRKGAGDNSTHVLLFMSHESCATIAAWSVTKSSCEGMVECNQVIYLDIIHWEVKNLT